jgi:hypothetical protein
VAKLNASVPQTQAEFGVSVAADGDTVVVGAMREDSASGHNEVGAVYVFERDAGGPEAWGEVARLLDPAGWSNDFFGNAVAVCGDTLAIGASGTLSGVVYLHERDQGGPGAWGQVAVVAPSDPLQANRFGAAVDLDGDTLVVGDFAWDPQLIGAAYVFERDAGGPGAWGQVAMLLASDGANGDRFGVSVGISGDTIVASAPNDTYASIVQAGSAYLFERDSGGPGAWGEVLKLTASDPTLGDNFGRSVAILDDRIAVGADRGTSPLFDNTGAAYLFERDAGGPGAWGEVKKLNASDGENSDRFGWSIALTHDTIAVGAFADDFPGSVNSTEGSAYLFERNQGGLGAWGEAAKLTASDGAVADWFGWSIAIAEHTTVVGALQGDSSNPGTFAEGAAYVFTHAFLQETYCTAGVSSNGCTANPGAGAQVQAQLWYRDPQNTSNQTTSLSDAIEFLVAP